MAREPHMGPVRNGHTAPIAKVAPGATGVVDLGNPGVRAALDAGLLQLVREDGYSAPRDEGSVPAAEHRRALGQIDAQAAENELLRREVLQLRAEIEEATRPPPPAAPAEPEEPAKAPKSTKATREG